MQEVSNQQFVAYSFFSRRLKLGILIFEVKNHSFSDATSKNRSKFLLWPACLTDILFAKHALGHPVIFTDQNVSGACIVALSLGPHNLGNNLHMKYYLHNSRRAHDMQPVQFSIETG